MPASSLLSTHAWHAVLLAAFFAPLPIVPAVTSYLAFELPGLATPSSSAAYVPGAPDLRLFAITYDPFAPGAPTTTYDLLVAIFGTASPTGNPGAFGTSSPEFLLGPASGQRLLGGIHPTFGLFVEDVFLERDPSSPGTLIGGINDDITFDPTWQNYVGNPDGSWSLASLGVSQRPISDGSFDAFIFGTYDGFGLRFPGEDTSGTALLASPSAFANAVQLSLFAIPEPSRTALLFVAAIALAARRSRPRP
jgi:hypothetical protein